MILNEKIKVWTFKEDENRQKLDAILEIIYRDIMKE